MNIKIEKCQNCPFFTTEWDEFDMSGQYYFYGCNFLKHKYLDEMKAGNKQSIHNIQLYKNGNVKSKNKKTLDNCPLLKENINITL